MSEECKSATGATCPSITNAYDGGLVVVGKWLAPDAAEELSITPLGVNKDEQAVWIPRDVRGAYLLCCEHGS
jgi:hypothetical protein